MKNIIDFFIAFSPRTIIEVHCPNPGMEKNHRLQEEDSFRLLHKKVRGYNGKRYSNNTETNSTTIIDKDKCSVMGEEKIQTL
jgi:NAD-dependent dihydropyrimidine dehydrogenase PreA subunit